MGKQWRSLSTIRYACHLSLVSLVTVIVLGVLNFEFRVSSWPRMSWYP